MVFISCIQLLEDRYWLVGKHSLYVQASPILGFTSKLGPPLVYTTNEWQ